MWINDWLKLITGETSPEATKQISKMSITKMKLMTLTDKAM